MYIEKEIPMLEKLLDFYRKSDGALLKCECARSRSFFSTPNGQKMNKSSGIPFISLENVRMM